MMLQVKETKTSKVLANPWAIYSYLTARGAFHWVPDALHCSLSYRAALGRWPDLRNPRTFNEKLQWLKLHDHNPLYNTLVDKYAVKEWVASASGPNM